MEHSAQLIDSTGGCELHRVVVTKPQVLVVLGFWMLLEVVGVVLLLILVAA